MFTATESPSNRATAAGKMLVSVNEVRGMVPSCRSTMRCARLAAMVGEDTKRTVSAPTNVPSVEDPVYVADAGTARCAVPVTVSALTVAAPPAVMTILAAMSKKVGVMVGEPVEVETKAAPVTASANDAQTVRVAPAASEMGTSSEVQTVVGGSLTRCE